jgi:hypothetical protein
MALASDEGDSYPTLPCQMDPERWFADETSGLGVRLVQSAIDSCQRCPALGACMKYTAQVSPGYGVWAGHYYTAGKR